MYSKDEKWIVVTTINKPTRAIQSISELCQEGWRAVVVGDTKTPSEWNSPGIDYLSVEEQKIMYKELSQLIPFKHYCRKNLGYLFAMQHGAKIILETDDDNIPYSSFGKKINRTVKGRILSSSGWINVYEYFSDRPIWPRGLPLDEISSLGEITAENSHAICPIQQYLADRDPDVDAIYRLLYKEPVFFRKESPVILGDGAWSPFNSQNTVFFSEVFPLLYLPCHVSFRMTDIWRSFVCNISLWVHGYSLSFCNATVEQFRNEHNLIDDFRDEVCGYLRNKEIAEILINKRSILTYEEKKSVANTCFAFWKSLAEKGIIPNKELIILERWIEYVRDILKNSKY